MNKIIVTILLILTQFSGFGKNIYVKQGNPTSNNGLTVATAVGLMSTGSIPGSVTISPGDVIQLIGTFTNPSYTSSSPIGVALDDARFWHGENTFRINNLAGSAGNYITIKPYDSNTLLKGDGGNIIRIQNSSYLKIEGFEIEGEVSNLPLSVANALQFVYVVSNNEVTDPAPADLQFRDQDCINFCVAGVVADGEKYSSINPNKVYRPTYYDTRGMYLSDVHHIDILNNHIHHMPGGGLRVSDCEDILIKGNEINDCSRRSSGGTHGLVVTKATSTRTTDDYRVSILNNYVHHNYNEQYSWAPDKIEVTPHIDEGKGISLQRNQTTAAVNWNHGRILIANNICTYNGFSGIHSNDGDRIDIINNTCYFNSYTGSVTIGGTNPNGGNIGISLSDGTGHKIINNICVIDNNMTRSPISTNITTNGALVVKNNVIYGTTGAVGTDADIDAIQVNTQMANPQFVNQGSEDFHLLSTSPAIDQGSTTAGEYMTTDYTGATRVGTADIGAFEYIASLPVNLTQFTGQNIEIRNPATGGTEGGNQLIWKTASEVNVKSFDIEKSFDGKIFEKWTEIKAKNTPSVYQHLDSPISKSAYYRLKINDLDGKVEYSKTILIEKKSKNGFMKIYPNPTQDLLFIESNLAEFDIKIINAFGQIVQSSSIQSGQSISIADLPNGLYILSIGGQIQKFLKQ